MKHDFREIVRKATGADACFHVEDIQTLWSGYGKIMRYGLQGGERDSVVVKHVKLPDRHHHPPWLEYGSFSSKEGKVLPGGNSLVSRLGQACDERCRIPHCFALESDEGEFLMVLEDLDASGFPLRKESVSMAEMEACLRCLANFHATFMGQTPSGLWEVGTYWHLDTRPDELAVLDDAGLKQAAAQIDQLLRTARYQTFVHGDAKLANFCFADVAYSGQGEQVAAVDFQYVGGGCGMKDVAYFIGSCLYEADCERYEAVLLDYYFAELGNALTSRNSAVDPDAVEQEWRRLYPVAWTDFHRFMKGWSPGHWKIHSYSERMARAVVAQLEGTPGGG